MLIGVVSDTHNNIKNIEKIISLFNSYNVEYVIHTGDVCNRQSLNSFSRLNSKLIGVYGNNDKEEKGLKEIAIKNSYNFSDPPKAIEIYNKKIMIFHEPDNIETILTTNTHIDLILHGHTHRFRHELINNTLVFNPGESAGMIKGKNAIGIVDLDNLCAKRIFF
jgi:putative phosphoesterase